MARIGTDKIWWNNAFFLNFISFDFCRFSCRKQLDFLGWRFLLNLFLVRIFLDGFIGYKCLLRYCLVEVVFWIWFVKISFHIFGQNVSFKCFLVVVVLPHQQSLLSEKNLQIIPAVESFHVTKIKCAMQIQIQNIESGFLFFWLCLFVVVAFLLVIQMWIKTVFC